MSYNSFLYEFYTQYRPFVVYIIRTQLEIFKKRFWSIFLDIIFQFLILNIFLDFWHRSRLHTLHSR